MQRILARIKTVGAGRVVRTTSFQLERSTASLGFRSLEFDSAANKTEINKMFGCAENTLALGRAREYTNRQRDGARFGTLLERKLITMAQENGTHLRRSISERSGGSPWARVLGGRNAGRAAAKHEHEFQAYRPEDYGYARADGARRSDDVPDHTDRHQPGHLRTRRSTRRREQDLRAVPEEPDSGRESVQHRQDFPQDQTVRRTFAAGRRGVRHRDGVVGPGREGVQRAGVPDAGRQVPRQHTLLRGHHGIERPEGVRSSV